MKKLTFTFLLVILSLVSFVSCKKKDSKVDETPKPSSTSSNLRLGTLSDSVCGNYYNPNDPNPNVNNAFCIRYFKDSLPKPLIIVFHGGGFVSGDKSQCKLPLQLGLFTNLITVANLDNNGFAYASANYRLLDPSKKTTSIDCLTDCKNFIIYMRDHHVEYNIDPNKIILLGFSGGAEAALWVGLQNNFIPGIRIRGIAVVNPQATINMLKWYNDVFVPYGYGPAFQNSLYTNILYMPFGLNTYANMLYGSTNPAVVNNYCTSNNLNYFNLFDPADPELYMACDSKPINNTYDIVHYTTHVYKLFQSSQAAGHSSKIVMTLDPYYANGTAESLIQFCIRKFK
jgi:predicted esterase